MRQVSQCPYDNKPIVPIMAFENDTERKTELGKIWDGSNGYNLIRVTRKQVVTWFGADFAINEYGECCKSWQAS